MAPPATSEDRQLRDHLEKVLVDEAAIAARLDELAVEITREYAGRNLTVVAILHGGIMFMADLLRRVHLPLKMESVSVASYHGGTRSSGEVTFNQIALPAIDGEDVLLLDDILDTVRTLHSIKAKFEGEASPASIRSCVLLDKKAARTVEFEADYVGLEIGDEFVVGYGLDYQGHYRNLPYIGTLRAEYIDDC